MTQQPAGWYPDPTDPDTLRYWDGAAWTGHTSPRQAQPVASHQEPGQSALTAPQAYGQPTTALPPPVPQFQGHAAPAVAAGKQTVTSDGALLASWGLRLGAWLIDGVVLFVIIAVFYAVFGPDSSELSREVAPDGAAPGLGGSLSGTRFVAGFLVWALVTVYCIVFWTTSGQTPGKKFVGISVRSVDRPGPLTLAEAARRRILSAVYVVPFLAAIYPVLSLLDYLWPLWDDRRQALHDKLAGTQVVIGKQPPRGSNL